MPQTSSTQKFRFTETEPTPLLKDFETFVRYLEQNAFALGKATEHIPYHFDFGDDWRFGVQLLEIKTDAPLLKKPQIIEEHGEAPEQYPEA